jgi:hypothetical protein
MRMRGRRDRVMAKYTFHMEMDSVGAEAEEIIDIPDKELEGKTEDEITEYLRENHLEEWVWDRVDAWTEKVEEEPKC